MSHTFAPFRQLEGLVAKSGNTTNVSRAERIASAVAGAALASWGAVRRDWPGLALGIAGGLLMARGATGHCPAYRGLKIDTTHTAGRGVPGDRGIRVDHSIEIARSPIDLYYFWRDVTNLPSIMPHVANVEAEGSRSHWTVRGPAGRLVEWDAEFLNDKPGELIAWQSLPGSEVQSAGSVRFEPVEGGTRLTVRLEYLPPAGAVGAFVAWITGASPVQQLAEDLARFKEVMERLPEGTEA